MRALARLPGTRLVARSRWHETEPVGGPPGQGPYLNGVVLLDTELEPRALLAELQQLEQRAGRVRTEKDGPRSLDLDLLLFGERQIDSPELRVPHPRLEERRFVLAPLSEVWPERRLASGRSVVQRLAELSMPAHG